MSMEVLRQSSFGLDFLVSSRAIWVNPHGVFLYIQFYIHTFVCWVKADLWLWFRFKSTEDARYGTHQVGRTAIYSITFPDVKYRHLH